MWAHSRAVPVVCSCCTGRINAGSSSWTTTHPTARWLIWPIFTDVPVHRQHRQQRFCQLPAIRRSVCREANMCFFWIRTPSSVKAALRGCFIMDERPKIRHRREMINGKGSFFRRWALLPHSHGYRSARSPVSSKLFPLSPKYANYSLLYLNHPTKAQRGSSFRDIHAAAPEALDKVGLLVIAFCMYGEHPTCHIVSSSAVGKISYVPERILHYKEKVLVKQQPLHPCFLGACASSTQIFPGLIPIRENSITAAIRLRKPLPSSPLHSISETQSPSPPIAVFWLGTFRCGAQTLPTDASSGARQPLVSQSDARILGSTRTAGNKMNGFTDYAFCYPDAVLNRWCSFADKCPDKESQLSYNQSEKQPGHICPRI